MCGSVWAPPALLALLVLTLVVPGGRSCPRSCNCYQASEVHCTFRSLLTVPPGLPAHTRRINLGFNSISRIHGGSLVGLKQVELLMLHSNDIHHLPDGGFRDMKSLQILKLSYNKLKEISSSLTFSGLTSLLRLYLDHNLLDHLHPRALLQLPSLRLLRLQGNRLHQLHPQALCTLSLLNTYYFSTLRHLDLSNNSLTTLPKDSLMKTPMLETLVLHTNPWSCDCRMNWLLNWSLAHPGLVKCPGGPQCPTCASSISLQGQGLLDRTDLPCTSPVISSAGRDTPLETDLSEIQSRDAFRDPLGAASLSLSDQQGNSVDLSCNVTHSDSQDIATLPDLSLSTSSPLPLALSLSLECPVERQSYEKLWRILAYYSETAVRLEREIMLSKAPALAYRYQQSAETGGYYHTGVKASVKVRPHWLLQPAISIQLNRAQSNAHKVHLIYSTRVSAHYGPTSTPPASSSVTHPWVLISANDTITAIAAVAGNAVELPCPHLSSGKPKVQWILPDRSKVLLSSGALDGRLQVSATGLAIQKAELSDAGIYYCVVQAGRDVDVLPVRLAVEESSVPSLGVPMGPSVTGAIGEPVSLSCTASGSPAPVIRWVLPDGSIIKRGLAASRGLTVQANGTLFLQSPSLRDAGYYLCLAINQYGNDYLSIQLELKPHQPPPLRTSFPRGPQSAAGRSTKIRAPLRQQMEEGSGYEEEEEDITLVASRNHPRPLQPPPSKQYPMGKARRRGPVRGRPIPATDQRRNRFDSRHRATPNNKRIDPKKWADLLAKIRQKTAHTNSSSQPSISGNPTAKPVGRSKDTEKHEAADNTERDTTEGAMEETDSEGSSVDDTVLQEEGLQPIHAVLKETQTQRETKTETETQPEKSTHIQTQDPRSQTESMTVTLTPKPMPGKNEIIPEDIIHPANHQELLPNLVPNSRPQRPWNSRRRIEQRRRINRPRVKPLTPHRPLPDPTNPTHHTQNVTPIRITDQTLIMLSLTTKTTSPAILLSTSEYIMPPPSSVAPDPLSSPGSHTVGIVKPASPSLAPLTSSLPSLSPSHTKTHTDTVTRSSDIADTAESTLFNAPTPAPTYSDEVISSTLVPDTRASTFTHGRHAHTQTHTALGKQTARPPGKHTEEVGVLHAPPSTTVSDAQSSTTKVTTRSTTLTSTRLTTSTGSTATISANPITSTIIVIPTTANIPVSTTTTTTTTATPTVSSKNRFTITSSKTPTKTIASTDTTPTTRVTTSSKTSPGTTRTTVSILPTTVTTSTKASSRQGSNVSQTNLTKPGSAAPKQSRPPTEWKNPGANSIPDSHNSRPQTPSHSAVPWAPVVRSRPRIADPHIRAASFPAESSARLACEARGEPKPSITWTKVATGAVMSVHSRAQRFEVLPNGTLVIQNVQLQDRGTYICSAHNFLGRDRLLTTLEVWTRPPRMQLVSYREVTIHQGGELLLQCRADGVPTPTLSWVLPDRSVVTTASRPDNHVAMDTNGTLRISVTLPSDRGVYRCVASNSAGAASSSVRVHVSSLPPVIQQAREEHLLLSPGRPFYAHCSARGAPPPTLRWRIPDGSLVRPSQFLHGNLFVLPNGTLHIRRIGPKDSGSYECMASNAVGADKRTVRVEVEDGANGAINGKGEGKEETKASVTEKTISLLNKNKSLSIPNYLSNPFNLADPSPPLSSDRSRNWPLTPSSSSNRHQPNSANPLLKKIHKTVPLTHLYINNNTKKVLPNIANNTTSDKSTASDVLQHLPNSHFSKARIVSTSPSVTIVQYGGILQLHCSVTGNPSPIIIWRTPNRKLVDKHFSFDRRLKVHPNGSLSVQAVTEKDAGDFLCIARNKVADDYRLMRVSVVTKPARIEPKQPVTQMVPLGKALKVDCQASGLPDPDVRWSLPDGTMVNSVLQGEDKGGRARRLTVFDNGTLLVPAVGVGEEGEYTCYAENQGGQDTMKVKVKIMATSPPAFSDDRVYRVVKVRQGSTAAIRCQVTADAATSITWFSPAHRVIPQISAAGYYSTRVAVVPSGTLEVRLAQKTDSGNYTCRASNSAGERGMVVGLEVESPTYELGGQVGGRTWTISNGSTNSRSGENTVNNAGTIKYNQVVSSSGDRHKQGSSSGYGNNGWTRHNVPNNGINIENRGSNPALRIYSQNQFNRPVSESTAPSSSSGISARLSNIGIRAGDTGENRNGAGIVSSRSNSVANSHSQVRGDGIEQNPGSKEGEVIVGKANDNASSEQTTIGGVSPNDGPGSSVQNSGAGNGTPSRNGFSIRSSAGLPNRVAEGVVMTSKQRAVKGHTVLLPCPSEGSPPPRLSWVLPGNGVLPAPYYGSRLTVHRNGSLELRGLRSTDAGPLVCVVRGEKGEQRIRVELEVYEPREEAGSSDGGTAAERTVQKNLGLSETHQSGHLLDSAQSLSSRTALPGVHPRVPITQHPLQKVLSFPSAPQPVEPPPRSAPQPSVSTRNAPLVSIVNGETLRLPCPAPQTSADARGSLTWTTPGGKVLTRSERSDRHQVQEDGTLTVHQASVFDRGTYTCTSTSWDSSSVSLVTVPVIIIAYPPRITAGPSPLTYTRPGIAVELPCLTIATPQATVTWETPDLTQLKVTGQARIYGNYYLKPQGSLIIQKPTSRDTGFYRCTAKNLIGVDTKVTYLQVI